MKNTGCVRRTGASRNIKDARDSWTAVFHSKDGRSAVVSITCRTQTTSIGGTEQSAVKIYGLIKPFGDDVRKKREFGQYLPLVNLV